MFFVFLFMSQAFFNITYFLQMQYLYFSTLKGAEGSRNFTILEQSANNIKLRNTLKRWSNRINSMKVKLISCFCSTLVRIQHSAYQSHDLRGNFAALLFIDLHRVFNTVDHTFSWQQRPDISALVCTWWQTWLHVFPSLIFIRISMSIVAV